MILLSLPYNSEDDSQFSEVVLKFERRIFNLIYRLIGDYEEAADLTQDTFVAAYKSIDGFRGESCIYTWLYRIAVNNCRNHWKNKSRRVEEIHFVDSDVVDALSNAQTQTTDGNPYKVLERSEFKILVEKAIMDLPDDYKLIAVLRDIQGLSYQDISQITGLSIDVVKTRLSRARSMLRRKLGPYLG
jgi:RNA polymerase sigma-70 factor (ECF subfamily)